MAIGELLQSHSAFVVRVHRAVCSQLTEDGIFRSIPTMVDFSWDFGGTYCKGLEESQALSYSPQTQCAQWGTAFLWGNRAVFGTKGCLENTPVSPTGK